jgi:hypothetical protein
VAKEVIADVLNTKPPEKLNYIRTVEAQEMRRIAKEYAVVFTITFSLCAFALLFAQGRIFPHALINSSLEKPVADNCFRISLPGVLLAVAIFGYASNRTTLSDLLVVVVNAVLYARPVVLLVHLARRRNT